MKKCLSLPIIVLALFATFIYIGCGAKQTPPVTTTATADAQEMHESGESAEADQRAESSEETSEHESAESEEGDADAEHESPEETSEHESAEARESHEAEEGDHESPEETSEHESAEARESHEAEEGDEDAEHESEETSEHESAEAQESHEAEERDENAEHESAEARESHETETETPHEAEPEMEEIPSDSVLHLIPQETIGLLYCPSLLELDYRINTLVTDLIPTNEAPEILAAILAEAFGAGFESLAELEEIGLDLNQDFAIFVTSLDPPRLSAVVHLTDPEAMKQVIDAESAGSAPVEHNGVTYWNASGGEGSFVILDNTLVFSESSEVCEAAIDTYKGTEQSIITNPDYTSFLTTIMAGDAQIAANINVESITPRLIAVLAEEAESIRDGMESDPAAMAFAPFLESMFDSAINILEQLETLSATFEVRGTDVQLAPSLKFKDDSEIQQALKKMIPDELTVLDDLPNLAFINGAFQGDQQLLVDMNMAWLKMFAGGAPEQQEKLETLTEQMETFYRSLDDEWGYTVNFSDSIIPNYLVIYGMKDKQLAKTYMDEIFLEQLRNTMQIMRGIAGDMPQFAMYDGAHAAPPIMHNDVEIKSYVFPNFGSVFAEMPPEAAAMMFQEWNWYYAFHEDQLFFAVGSSDLIKAALDRKAGESAEADQHAESSPETSEHEAAEAEEGDHESPEEISEIGESLSENPSYQKLIDVLGTDNNMLLTLSPMTLVKSLIPIIAKADPDAGAAMQMFGGMFMNVPERYSLSFSAKVQEDGGIGTKLLLSLGDFKQAIQMMVMMQNMEQMQ